MATQAIVQLQGAVGNRATAQILARYKGDGKHLPTDVRFAARIGKADAARLDATTDGLSAAMRKDVTEKRSWFKGAARDAYRAEARDHTDDERDMYAPLGAAKLYEAIKSKPIRSTKPRELYKGLSP